MKKYILIISIFLISALAVLTVCALLFLPSSPVTKAPIQGYLFVSKKGLKSFNGKIETKIGSGEDIFIASNENWKKKYPLAGVTVSLLGKNIHTVTDEKGFFELYDRKYYLKKDSILIEISKDGRRMIEYPVQPEGRQTQRGDKVLHIINIKEDGNIEITYLKEKNKNEKNVKQPVLMVHGFGPDFGPFSFSIGLKDKKWAQTQKMFEKDRDLEGFDFFLFEYLDDQDIVSSSRELAWAIERLNRIYSQKTTLLSFSMGGLVCRHCLVSDWYKQGSVDKLLMVGTPNHGCDLAIMHLDTDFGDGDGAASLELLEDSDLLKTLNNKTNDISLKQKYHINEKLQDHRGLNPGVDYAIIAGEVTQSIKDRIAEAKKGVMGFITELFDLFDDILYEFLGESLDKDSALGFFESLANEGNLSFEQIINDISHGDLIVTLESALIDGVPYITIPYFHENLILPIDEIDIRYILIKQFIVEGNLNDSKQGQLSV